MSGKTDVIKGRLKEAAGRLTGSEKLRAKGKTDQRVGEVKQAAKKTAVKVEKAAKKARRKYESKVIAACELSRVYGEPEEP
jgi:uncharacterized protein YjbJ (UPF0337 family)